MLRVNCCLPACLDIYLLQARRKSPYRIEACKCDNLLEIMPIILRVRGLGARTVDPSRRYSAGSDGSAPTSTAGFWLSSLRQGSQ